MQCRSQRHLIALQLLEMMLTPAWLFQLFSQTLHLNNDTYPYIDNNIETDYQCQTFLYKNFLRLQWKDEILLFIL